MGLLGMRTLLSRAIQFDPTFQIGASLVLIIALAEIFAATYYYVGRAHANHLSSQVIAAAVTRTPAPAVASVTPAPANMQSAVSSPAVAEAPASAVDQLLRQGVELRDRGDTTTALKHFEEALDKDPNNTAVLTEAAKTYDLMQLYDRANEMWRKIQEMGPAAGAAYELADQRLKVGVQNPAAEDSDASKPATDTAAQSHKDVGGKPEGPIMAITDVKTTETSDPDADANIALQIGIKRQPNATVDHNKVKILVFLYDIVDDKDIKLTDADVSNDWLTPTHDWSGTDPEILSVKYVRPKTAATSADSSSSATTARHDRKTRGAKGAGADIGRRKYLGYIVRIYYDDELQAVQAEPSRLLQQFPPSKNSSP
jgi:tetratricopeptide (TPR) repeat protein